MTATFDTGARGYSAELPLIVRPSPPISAATLVPTANSPPGQESTMPTHSIPLTGAASAHSPRLMCISAWLIPNALIRMTPMPSFGSGFGMSLYTSASRPPNPSSTIAFISLSSRCRSVAGTPKRPPPCSAFHMPLKKIPHRRGNLLDVRFKRKVTRIEKMHFGPRDITLVSLRARRDEERIVLAPDRERRRLRVAEEFLEGRIELHVRRIVEEQVELDVFLAFAFQQRRIERVRLGLDRLRM